MDDDVVVRTSFGAIRRWRAEDAPALSRHGDDRRIWRNMSDGLPSPFTPGRAEAFIAMTHRQSPTTYFAIAGEAEEAIGGIGLGLGTDVHRHTAELGYWLAAPLWGRGYMREAIACFTRAAFTRFGVSRIFAQPYARNAGSIRALERAGFVLEGRLRRAVLKEGELLDQCVYARLVDDPEP